MRTISSASSDRPSVEQLADLVPRPGSLLWIHAGDVRLLAGAGYALLLQVSHPTVGAGVSEHSDFKADPWGRLLRTLDYSYSIVYGGPELAVRVGGRVFELHKRITGVRPDGQRYRALEPEAYAWVHATLAESIVTGNRRFGVRMKPDDVERFWSDWRRLGRVVGVQVGELPEGWGEFRAYFDRMVAERLEDNDAVHDVLDALARPERPRLPLLNDAAWRLARLPMARLLTLATAGMVPPLLRKRFGVRWTRAQELELRALSAAARSATPLMPGPLRNTGPIYLRWRRQALERAA